jgi:hypothetical protein
MAETLIEFREWGPAVFEEARAAGRPVFLYLTAPWCSWCERMEREALSAPGVAANVNDSFLPVRVDADRQPRVRERYGAGGFPSTAFCTPDGRVIAAAGYMGTDDLRGALERVRGRYEQQGADAGRTPEPLRESEPPSGELAGIEAHINGQLEVAFDAEHGGWGTDAKFPLPRTIEYALKRDRPRALRTLTAIREHLQDADGGFYRYAGQPDWSDPHRERLLDENAALLRAFAAAYLYTGDQRFREAAADAVDYLTDTLWTDGDHRGRGAFAGSQAGTRGLPPGERPTEPPVDRTVFADRNGLAVDALLRFHAYTDHAAAREHAERALATVTDRLVDDGEPRHYDGSGAERGLLADAAALLGALTTAAGVLGREHLGPARAVADRTLECRLADGGFLDGPPEGPGLLARPLRPVEATAALAEGLVDLAALTDEDRYREAARTALETFAGARDRMGVELSGYAGAVARVREPPLTLLVDAPPGSDLHRAAWRVADHEKRVVPTGDHRGRARVRGREGSASTPEELLELVASERATS